MHEHVEVARAAGDLDVASFCKELQGFDTSLNQFAALSIQTDLELAVAQERLLQSSKAADNSHSTGDPEAIPRHVFIRVCEEHGLRKSRDLE